MGKQHVDLFRKVLLRQKLLTGDEKNFYVPFIGDGDIAHELYTSMIVYGADIDSTRVSIAEGRIQGKCIVADCDQWPFSDVDVSFDGGDFDAYSHPYKAFVEFWHNAKKSDTLTLFFTDGHRQGIKRTKIWIKPTGESVKMKGMKEVRDHYNFYFQKYILPWFCDFIRPYTIKKKIHYLRKDMLYWGCVINV